jgi:rhodanese-related sulfurtransferase
LDVRTPSEFKQNHLKGAKNIPLNDLNKQETGFQKDQNLVVHCKGGYRSTIACSILQKNGFSKVINLLGGLEGIEKSDASSRKLLVS